MFYYEKKDLGPYLRDYKPIYDFLYVDNASGAPSLVIFEIIPERKAHMTFDPWFKVKYHGTKQKPIYDFLYAYNTSGASISRSFLDI